MVNFADVKKPLPSYAAIRALAAISRLAYSPYPDQALPGLLVSVVSRDDVDCLLVSDDTHLVIAFRGTEWSWREWLRNLSATPSPHGLPFLYHAGYYDAIEVIQGDLLESMHTVHGVDVRHNGPWKQLILTGHSQGGALAGTLAAMLLPAKRIQSICTFNAPAFCGHTEKQMLERRLKKGNYGTGSGYLRVCLGNDVVSRIPVFFRNPRFPLLPTHRRFSFVGQMAHLVSDGSLLIDPPAAKLRWRRLKDFRVDMLRDHSIERIEKALQNAKNHSASR